jgi:drug/metabolite transporter (DMT)-like permease
LPIWLLIEIQEEQQPLLNPKILTHLALFIVALIYGLNFIIAKHVLDDGYLSPFQFILLRVAAGAILFWVFFSWLIKERIDWRDVPYLFLCAVFGAAINQLSFFEGLKYTTPIHASLLMTLVPILVLLASRVILSEKITIRKMMGIGCGLAGAVYLIQSGHSVSINNTIVKGDLYVMVNVTTYGLYLVLIKKMISKYNPITVVTWLFTFGLLIVFPFGWQGMTEVNWSGFPSEIWWAIAYVLIGTTFLTYLLNAYALSRVQPSTVSIYIYLQPLIASVAAVLINNENFGIEKWVSGLLIFIGVYFVSFTPKKILEIKEKL